MSVVEISSCKKDEEGGRGRRGEQMLGVERGM